MSETESVQNTSLHCVLYGGNGFVGTAIAKTLVDRGCKVSVVSRTGEMPNHLYFSGVAWAKSVDWLAGDALSPDTSLVASADVVVTLIGSPPLPTMSVGARRLQQFTNGEPNAKVIRTAKEQGVPKIILMAADIPVWMQTKKFGYYMGKEQSIDAAKQFADELGWSAAILYPTGIYGKRHTKSGTAIPLDWVMRPVALCQRAMPKALSSMLPPTLVSVEQVAQATADACFEPFEGVKHIQNDTIAALSCD